MLATPLILAFDAATGPCSAAIWKDGGIAAYLENPQPVMQSTRLMPMVEEVMAKAGVAYKDLTAIACTVGPGSFTGIRIGLAAARGLCFAANLPGRGFTTMEVLAQSAQTQAEGGHVLVVMNAGKSEVYYQGFSTEKRLKPLFSAQIGSLEAAKERMQAPFVTVGNVPVEGATALDITFPRADALAKLAALQEIPASSLKPLYIRPPDATPLVKNRQALL